MGNANGGLPSENAAASPAPAPSPAIHAENLKSSLRIPGIKSDERTKSVRILDDGNDRGKNDMCYTEPLKDSQKADSYRDPSHRRAGRNISAPSPFSSESSNESIPIPSLHGSLLRVNRRRDPLRYYQVVKVLGDGSMGSVSKVQKRKSAQGGSARRSFVRREKRHQVCWGLFDFCEGFHLFCPIRVEDDDHHRSSSRNEFFDSNPSVSSISTSGTEEGSANQGNSPNFSSRRNQFANNRSSSMITYNHRDAFYALKSIHLDRCRDNVFRQELINEIAILQRLDHPHIVKAMETFDYKDRLFVVLELCSGGDLYTRDPYSEIQACAIVHDVLDAVAYMHARGITHRDLKFENIMFSSPDSDSVKVIDFGLSKKYSEAEHLHDTVGTVYTMAPEVLKGKYDRKCDCWSMGVIAFMLISSSLPFYGKTRQHIVRKVLNGKYAFKGHRWQSVSSEAKEFVMECLVRNPASRKSAEELMKHPFILRNDDDNRKANIGFALMDRVQATIQTYSDYERIKKLALLVIAHKSTDDEIGFLRRVFNMFDKTVDGEIVFEEFEEVLEPYHYDIHDLERMFAGMDLDGTGKVHYTEFLAATIEAHGTISEERLAEAFDRLDSDDSGYITRKNIIEFLGDAISEEYASAIIAEADITLDQRISYDEFLNLWSESHDNNFKRALQDVNSRRASFDDYSVSDSIAGDSVGTSQSSMPSEDTDAAVKSTSSSNLGGGSFFFDVEKEKSIRGVWV